MLRFQEASGVFFFLNKTKKNTKINVSKICKKQNNCVKIVRILNWRFVGYVILINLYQHDFLF